MDRYGSQNGTSHVGRWISVRGSKFVKRVLTLLSSPPQIRSSTEERERGGEETEDRTKEEEEEQTEDRSRTEPPPRCRSSKILCDGKHTHHTPPPPPPADRQVFKLTGRRDPILRKHHPLRACDATACAKPLYNRFDPTPLNDPVYKSLSLFFHSISLQHRSRISFTTQRITTEDLKFSKDMVLVSAVRDYINRMLQDISGMKVLILDSSTVSIVSVVYSQSDLLQKEVFLVELVDSISKSREPMSHLKAVYFLRPTSENIQQMRRQLASPRFGEYHLFFSNMLKDTQLHILADSDEHEAVQQVQEFYADFVAIDPFHFTLNIPSNHMYMLPAVVDPSGLQQFCDRVVDGIAAIFLALKRRPVIRYQRTSDIAKRVAQETAKLMYQQESGLFDFRRTEISPLLLIIDRRDDPVTPLLNQWTYQAMVHELIGIQDNKVDLRNIGKISKDQQEVVLSSEQDAFFKANMYENFGDIGMNIKRMVDEFQLVAKSNQSIQTIEDMAKFVDNYPEYRKMQGNVSKHVTLVTEMSKIVEERKLMLVSQTEQELACNGGQGAAFEAVTNLLNNDNVSDIDRLRLVMLYALRYEKESPVQLMQLFNKLASCSPKYKPGLVQFLLKQAGVDKRTGDLYGNRDLLNIARNMARGLSGVENVYTQHQPLLFQTMESIVKGRVRDVDYPFVGNHFQQSRPQEVVIFVVGGTTYEESRSVALQNSANSGIRFILGGSAILNSKRFLKDLEEAQRIARTSTNVV